MRIHVPAVPHARTVSASSHCAFSGKIRRLAPMLAPLGYELIHYGVGAPDSPGWADHVDVMTEAEQVSLLGYDPLEPTTEFVGRAAHVNSPLYRAFNDRLRAIWQDQVGPDDVVALPFGHAHWPAAEPWATQTLETGIGYPVACSPYRIYESYAWMHWHLGKAQRGGWVSEWVVPNYFDVAEWPMRTVPLTEGGYVLYLGRIIPTKGINIVWELARARPDLEFVLCGQGDASPWLTLPNLHYVAPVTGMARAAMFHGARCTLLPTQYVEPFGGVAIESMLTGTPVLTSDFGAFNETVTCRHCRCHTLGDWLRGLDHVLTQDPATLRQSAIDRYSLPVVAQQYDRILKTLPDLRAHGWQAGGSDQEMAHARIA